MKTKYEFIYYLQVKVLTLFPIHIIELVTLGLIFLFVYRIIKQLSLETFPSSATHTAISEHSIQAEKQVNQTKTSHPEHSLTESQAKEYPTSEQETCSNLYNTTQNISAPNIKDKPPATKPQQQAGQNQAMLKNYIGDFF